MGRDYGMQTLLTLLTKHPALFFAELNFAGVFFYISLARILNHQNLFFFFFNLRSFAKKTITVPFAVPIIDLAPLKAVVAPRSLRKLTPKWH